MCRIAGIIAKKRSEDFMRIKVGQMCAALAHGGPDDEGFYYSPTDNLMLGHRRLSVIDLSSRGHQPMTDADQCAWISFNGEIYNYLDLKAELQALGSLFKTATDTEVIIQGYLQHGETFFTRLRGMFAFALYDSIKRLTWLVRDSSGIKPLYYHAVDDELYFASETRAFKAAAITTEQDRDWTIRFLAFGHIQEPYTVLKNVFSLPKGHYLCWDHSNNTYQVNNYWHQHNAHAPINNKQEAAPGIRRHLNTAIQRQLIADAPIGVFLSGGLDSSLITLQAANYTKALKTVSIFFDEPEYNELSYQQTVIKHSHVANDRYLVKKEHFEQALPAILKAMDMPTTDGINTWFISKYASKSGLKAVLSGLGADELFGGYPSFKRITYIKYLKLIPKVLMQTVARLSTGRLKRFELLQYKHPIAEYLLLRGLFVPTEIAAILGITVKQVTEVLFARDILPDKETDALRAAWYETNLYMQNQLLRDTDVMSMNHGLEVRIPFLDEDLQQFTANISSRIRFDIAQPKGLLAESYTDVLPESIGKRRKMGFSFPLQQWMRQHPQIGNKDFYKNKASRKIIGRFEHNKVHWSKAFALYQLQLQEKVPRKKILFLTLHIFGDVGGLQKMCRTMAYTLQNIAHANNWDYNLWSGYDSAANLDTAYTLPENFKGFEKKRRSFVLEAVQRGLKSDVVILSHINMAVIGRIIKIIKPTCQVWVVAHGIEVWRPLKASKKHLLANCDKIICVSNFTKQKMVELHTVPENKCVVLNNTLDPYLKLPEKLIKPAYLLERYGLTQLHQIIFTLTRLAATEQYKGYEQVIKSVSELKKEFPRIRYILSGKYDTTEQLRINQLIKDYNVVDEVILTGFISESELEDHFLLADLFVLPSKKEGFGIVFIEAMACGLPVICGNSDGSVDAIKNGELGRAVNVDHLHELTEAIRNYLDLPLTVDERRKLQQKCVSYFNTNSYKNKLEELLVDKAKVNIDQVSA